MHQLLMRIAVLQRLPGHSDPPSRACTVASRASSDGPIAAEPYVGGPRPRYPPCGHIWERDPFGSWDWRRDRRDCCHRQRRFHHAGSNPADSESR